MGGSVCGGGGCGGRNGVCDDIFMAAVVTIQSRLWGDDGAFWGGLLGAGGGIGKGGGLFPPCYYALFAGVAAILIGIRFIDLGLTMTPRLSGIGFILTGLCGVCSGFGVKFKNVLWLRLCGAIVLFVAAAIWLYIGGQAFWGHLKVN